ncbi:MAG TPA: efflux RND transporter periplasmic adaptor subunit [Chryseolinea sp.]|nr:efflux RND transporter periplasmic adaptor subunit [Chryseolinea sp.]
MKLNFNMNSNIYTRLSVLTVIVLLTACSATTPEDDKQSRLKKLKEEQASLSKEIKKLEDEVAKANPDSVAVKAKEIAVIDLAPRSFDYSIQTQGSVEAEDNIMLSAKSMGAVTAVYVTEGQQISKGQALVQLDNGVIKRTIEAMKAQLELATAVYNRQKNLWDQKIGTEVQYLQAKTNKENLERQVESMKEQSDMSTITSPINGTVDELIAKVGENLSPGMPAARVINSSNLKLKANVSEAYVTNIKKGNKVLINIPELKKELTAQVSFVGRNIDPLSRTFTVEIKLPSLADLRPNMTGLVKVIFHSEASTIVVPINVVQDVNKEKVVYIAEMSGKQMVARKRVVTVDAVYDNLAQVQGLKTGDKVITSGYQGLNDGQAVKL